MEKPTGKPLSHWPADTIVEEGVWRDYYSGEKLENYTKPWHVSSKAENIWF